jgi:tetratricopeptide (TPR) repeat protein
MAVLLAACTIPINTGLGGPREPVDETNKAWEQSTEAGAEAYQEGRLAEAEAHLDEARKAAESEAETSDEYATSLINLGIVASSKGDMENAIAFYSRALEIREKNLGPDHLEVAATLNRLGATYAFLQRNEEAETALRRALSIRELKLGERNRLTGQSYSNLALLFAGMGDYDKAELYYLRAIDIIEHAPNSSRGDLIRVLENYAAMLGDAGRTEDLARTDERIKAEKAEYDKFHDLMNPQP